MELRSQKLRKIAPEIDPLRLGTGWKLEDLSKPQIIIESTFGDSHPGSGHLLELVEEARKGIAEAGGFGARYFCTDICDGESQGHDGINYSLPSRDMIANMIEIHANATPFDGGVFIASCDKGMPAHLMAVGRVNIPSIVVTGGVMDAGPDLLTLEQIGKYNAMCERGEITKEKMEFYKHNACPSCGACSFMGTASTMQIMAEALGLMLPGSALMPATSQDLREFARKAGEQAVWLARHDLTPDKIVTMDSFENAIMVHAAISGSTNSLLHIPAIAKEFGIKIDGNTFDRLHRGAHYLLNIRPAGEWPAQFFYYAGGVPAIMEEIKDMLHLDVMTVTGKTLGENLEELKRNGFYEKCESYLKKWNLKREDVIRPFDKPFGTDGSIAILKGNLAPNGAVVKHTAVPKEMFQAVLRARPYNCEEDAIKAVLTHEIKPGDAVIIRYEGPKAAECRKCSIQQKQLHRRNPWCKHCAPHRWPFLRRIQRPGNWTYLTRSSRRWFHCSGRRRGFNRGQHTRSNSANCRNQWGEKISCGNRPDSCREEKEVEAYGKPLQKRCIETVCRQSRFTYGRRIYGGINHEPDFRENQKNRNHPRCGYRR